MGKKFWFELILVAGLFLGVSYATLWPGSELIFQGDARQILGDGTDTTASAYTHSQTLQSFHEDPRSYFYGAVPSSRWNAPEGELIWINGAERWFLVLAEPWVPLEQLNPFWAFTLIVITGLSFYLMGRVWGWPVPVALGLSLAWAVSPYMRARAKVHMGFLATYHLPLIFAALFILAKGRGWRSVAGAALLLWFASGVPQYYIIVTALVSPFLIGIYFVLCSQPWPVALRRIVIAAVPAVLSLVLTLVFPGPSEYLGNRGSAFGSTGESATWPHPFLETFASRPLDFFTGDTGISTADINPLKTWLNEKNFEWFPYGNSHERTNGIRWVLWLAFVVALIAYGGRIRYSRNMVFASSSEKTLIGLFVALGIWALLLSFPPSYYGSLYGPSALFSKLIPQFRVSNRSGLWVHFAVLMVVGIFLAALACGGSSRMSLRWGLWIFPVLMILEFPPFWNAMPVSTLPERNPQLQGLSMEQCGRGMSFPYLSPNAGMMEYYSFLSRLRGSGCAIVNANGNSAKDTRLVERFGLHNLTIRRLQSEDASLVQDLIDWVKCADLAWVEFDARLSPVWAQNVCTQVGGTLIGQTCRRPFRQSVGASLESCL